MYNCEIIADSKNQFGDRITTFVVTYPRIIHAEMCRHRMFSRNTASCLTGDTVITIEKPSLLKKGLRSKHTSMTIKDIVNKWFNGDSRGVDMKTRLKRMNLRCLNENTGEFTTTKIKNCFKQGIQNVYEITLENGKTIRCTSSHRIFSENGWVTLSDIGVQGKDIISWDSNAPRIATNGVSYTISEFENARESGMTLREYCKEQGYNEKSARSFCERNNIKFRKIVDTPKETFEYKDKDWLIYMKEKGYTNGKIAELCNTTEDRVKRSCKKLNVRGYTGNVLKGDKKRVPWNKGMSYTLPDSSLVNVRANAEARKKSTYKFYKDFNAKVTRFLHEVRQEVYKRDNYTCQISGSRRDLELHHIDPVWNNKEAAFDKSNLISLNKEVHRFIHNNNLDLEFFSYYKSGKDVTEFLKQYSHLKLLCDDINKPKSPGNTLSVQYSKIVSIKYLGGKETYDLEVEGPYHNFVADGVVVHNSRAIPTKKMFQYVEEDPFIPIAWQKNHKGMQGKEYVTDYVDIQNRVMEWLGARDFALAQAMKLAEMGTTKQLINRLLEPFQWTTEIITATELENFFQLRCPQYKIFSNKVIEAHNLEQYYFRSKKDVRKKFQEIGVDTSNLDRLTELEWLQINESPAEIHIQKIAEMMWDAYDESKPKQLNSGEWHVPFGDNFDKDKLSELEDFVNHQDRDKWELPIKIATARCARVSYVNYEGGDNYHKDIKLHDQLYQDNHASPFEHCAQAMGEDRKDWCITSPQGATPGFCRNFRGFISYREICGI